MEEFIQGENNNNNEDLVELIEKINRLVDNKELERDYEDIVEG